jgi:hypothetical protein
MKDEMVQVWERKLGSRLVYSGAPLGLHIQELGAHLMSMNVKNSIVNLLNGDMHCVASGDRQCAGRSLVG